MIKQDIFVAIDQCDEQYIEEVTQYKLKKHYHRRFEKEIRIAVAAIICIAFLGICVTVTASTSKSFNDWIIKMFGISVSRVQWNDSESENEKPDEKKMIDIGNNTKVCGEKETFIAKYHYQGEDEVVDSVYSVVGNSLKEIKLATFSGSYAGKPFSFEYAVIDKEVYGCNLRGNIEEVFNVKKGNEIFVALWNDGSKIDKGCIAKINLTQNSVEKLSNDKMICNFLMSPNGKKILCNHRSDGYWSVFDIAARSEKIVKDINGYAHMKEVKFVDDTHILILGKTETKRNEGKNSTYLINLDTQKIDKEYKNYGEIDMEWSYSYKNGNIKFTSIISDAEIVINDVSDTTQPMAMKGEYVLLGDCENSNAEYYLCNLENRSYQKVVIPAEFRDGVQIYLVAQDDNILFSNGTEAFLVKLKQ